MLNFLFMNVSYFISRFHPFFIPQRDQGHLKVSPSHLEPQHPPFVSVPSVEQQLMLSGGVWLSVTGISAVQCSWDSVNLSAAEDVIQLSAAPAHHIFTSNTHTHSIFTHPPPHSVPPPPNPHPAWPSVSHLLHPLSHVAFCACTIPLPLSWMQTEDRSITDDWYTACLKSSLLITAQ